MPIDFKATRAKFVAKVQAATITPTTIIELAVYVSIPGSAQPHWTGPVSMTPTSQGLSQAALVADIIANIDSQLRQYGNPNYQSVQTVLDITLDIRP